jgi:hypothetical protein
MRLISRLRGKLRISCSNENILLVYLRLTLLAWLYLFSGRGAFNKVFNVRTFLNL